MNGAGNDFIVIDNRFYHFSEEELSSLAKSLCHRRVSIGADGLLLFMAPDDEQFHYRMKYFNADGSLGTMCGNGACCLARYAQLAGFEEAQLTFESDAGVYTVEPGLPDTPVRLFVPPPRDIRLNLRLEESDGAPLHYIWTGTEHAVRFVDDVAKAPLEDLGPRIRSASRFAPAGVNVNFVQVTRPGDEEAPAMLEVRTYEKGVECETLACGTGALASAILAGLTHEITVSDAEVHMPGGLLGVGYSLDEGEVNDVYLEGRVETVFRGTLEV